MTTEQLPEGLQLAASLLKAHCDAHPFTHTALTAIRTAADRIADLETKCATLKRLHDAAADERDALREQINACTPHLRERLDGGLESPADMLAMREREVLGLLGRLSDAQMQGDALRARLAEIEAQEPVATAWIRTSASGVAVMANAFPWPPFRTGGEAEHWKAKGYHEEPLYAGPITGQAVLDGWRPIVYEPADSGLYWVLIGDQPHVARFSNRTSTARWWSAYGIPRAVAEEPTHWMPIPAAPEHKA